MRSILSERNIVVILFVLVLITFSFAQEDSKKMEQMYSGASIPAVSKQLAEESGRREVGKSGSRKVGESGSREVGDR